MNITVHKFLPVLVASLGMTAAASADSSKPDFEARVAAGYQHDSNVSLSELDTNTGEADNAALLELGLDAGMPLTDAFKLQLGYGYSLTRYQDFSEFDTAIHRLQADARYRVGGFDLGLALRQFDVRLDNDRFLDIRQVSPNVARMLGKKLYVRGAYTKAEKTYAERPERDAGNDAMDLDIYLLLDGMQRYLSIGYSASREDATGDEFDYDGRRTRLAYGHRFDRLQLKARLQFDDRDYANVTEAIGARRRDNKFRAGVTATVPLNDTFEIVGDAQYADTASNLDTANYDEMIYGINIAAKF